MKINNLGVLKKTEIELSQVLIFTGENNSGKTYTSYLLYGLFSAIKEFEKQSLLLKQEIGQLFHSDSRKVIIKKEELKTRLYKLIKNFFQKNIKDIAVQNFKISEEEFSNLIVEVSNADLDFFIGEFYSNSINTKISIDDIEINIFSDSSNIEISINSTETKFSDFLESILIKTITDKLVVIPSTFYFPAERNGINVFKNELNENRLKTFDNLTQLIQYSSLKNKKEKEKMRHQLFQQNMELLFEDSGEKLYPKPISDYITFLNSIKPTIRDKNSIAEFIRNDILSGKFEIDEKTNQVYFRQKYGKTSYKRKVIPFHVLSSSIKSLFGLDYYLDNVGRKGDVLIIDEPELSLHPENQIRLANALADIAKSGIKIILSTHSDILVRTLSNIVLENKIKNNEGISTKNVNLYNFGNGNVKEYKDITDLQYFDNFDSTIFKLQNHYNDLLDEYYSTIKN